MSNDRNPSHNELLFVQLVSMFQVAALQHMGKLPNPVTNKIERDLEQARISVDILGMLKEKTKGNLSENETEFLSKVLYECQMNYLDELKKPEEPQAGTTDTAEAGSGGKTEPSDSEEGASPDGESKRDDGDAEKGSD